MPNTIYFERFKQYASNKAGKAMTSSAHDQKAINTLVLGKREGNNKSQVSPFTIVLMNALKNGSAD